MKLQYDVIIVGGGGSGLAAAVSCAENGLDALLLEKLPVLGGTTGIAVGSITANRTALQRKRNIEDSLEAHLEDIAKFARPEDESRNNSALRRFFLSQTAGTYDWLAGMGLAFHGPSPEPPNRVPRMHNVVPNAKAYIATLQHRLLRLGGVIRCNAAVTGLSRENGRVIGIQAEIDSKPATLKARRGVVLAAGDYAGSRELIARHKGGRFAAIEGINPHARGDGQNLVAQAGGQLLNMDMTWGPEIRFIPPEREPFVRLLPTGGPLAILMGKLLPVVPRFVINSFIKRLLVTWQHPDDSLFDNGCIMVNARGERFCNEKIFPEREIALAAQPGKIAYILLDERLVKLYSAWPRFISTAPEIAYAYVEDYLRMRPDVCLQGPTLQSAAAARGIPAKALEHTVDAFNLNVVSGTDDPFGRTGDTMPLTGSRWVLLGPAKAYFTITEGGAAINQDMQVLDNAGEPIPGLYAVGCNGLGGQVLFSHGLHIAWAMTSGRLVGGILARDGI